MGLAIGAALGLVKNKIAQEAADRKRKLAAATSAYSPWTKLTPENVQDPNLANDVIQVGGAGAAMASGINKDNAAADLMRSGSGAINSSIGDPQTNALGSMDMSAKLGSKAADFQKSSPSSWSGVDAAPKQDPYWSFGHGLGQQYSQPSLSSQLPGDPNDPAVKYKTLLSKGLSPNNPEDSWQINPFKLNY